MIFLTDAISRCFERQEGGQCLYWIGEDFPAFEGHFPQKPILPAVVQVQFALDALARLQGGVYQLKKVSKAKFSRPVAPNTRLGVEITPKPQNAFCAQLTLPDGQKCGQIIFEVELHEAH